MKVGSGKFAFEAIEGWGQLPPGWSYGGQVPGVAVDSQDRVYALNRGAHPVIIFDPEGRFLGSWGEGLFSRPHGLCIGADDTIYCVDDQGQAVRHFTLDGGPLAAITVEQPVDTGYKPGYLDSVVRSGPPFCYPTDLVFSPDGDMYVAEMGLVVRGNVDSPQFFPDGPHARVTVRNLSGGILAEWGARDPRGAGLYFAPHGIAMDSEKNLYVGEVSDAYSQGRAAPDKPVLNKYVRL